MLPVPIDLRGSIVCRIGYKVGWVLVACACVKVHVGHCSSLWSKNTQCQGHAVRTRCRCVEYLCLPGGSCVIRIASIHAVFKGVFMLSPHLYPQKEKCKRGGRWFANNANPPGFLALARARARNDPRCIGLRKEPTGGVILMRRCPAKPRNAALRKLSAGGGYVDSSGHCVPRCAPDTQVVATWAPRAMPVHCWRTLVNSAPSSRGVCVQRLGVSRSSSKNQRSLSPPKNHRTLAPL
jgi:hypothetical protein